jgi:hypothetical protein
MYGDFVGGVSVPPKLQIVPSAERRSRCEAGSEGDDEKNVFEIGLVIRSRSRRAQGAPTVRYSEGEVL